MPRTGKHLEGLVRAIEKATNQDPNVTIESPKKLRDKDTGRLREHDVVLTIRQAHHDLVIAIECRDRSRKIGVPAVEEFYAKCQRTGVDRGIMISPLGFAKTAITKARSYNIGCLTLDEATGFDWCLARGIHFRNRKLLSVKMRGIVKGEPVPGAVLHDKDGRPLNNEQIKKIGLNALNQMPTTMGTETEEPIGRELRQVFVDKSPPYYAVDACGKKSELVKLVMECVYRVEEELVPFDFHLYSDASAGADLYGVASAPISFGNKSGKILIVNKSDEGSEVVLVFDEACQTNPQTSASTRDGATKTKDAKMRKRSS